MEQLSMKLVLPVAQAALRFAAQAALAQRLTFLTWRMLDLDPPLPSMSSEYKKLCKGVLCEYCAPQERESATAPQCLTLACD